MTYSRPVPKGRTLVMDRRTTRRFFLMRPDGDRRSQQIVLYLLAVVAAKHRVSVHAVVQMSTHWHVYLTDVGGVLPEFLAEMHRVLAMCLKRHRGWDEEVWNKSQTSVLDIETVQGALKQLAYVMNNPIEAGMVERLEEYPGLVTRPEQIGRVTFTVRRPANSYLANDALWPRTATLRFEVPPVLLAEYGEARARREIMEATRQHAETLRRERATAGLGYLGARAVCSAPVTAQPTKEIVSGGRNPTFTLGSDEHAERQRKRRELREWRAAYARCLERWRRGERDAVWPPHTWKMRVLHGAPCAASD